MNIDQLLKDIEKNCKEITYLCAKHILEKLYDIENDTIEEKELIELFSNYTNFQRYLNDYAGMIYKRYFSSVEEVYNELCNFLDIDDNNQYMFEFDLNKLEKQTPSKLMQIENEDLKYLTIEKQESKLEKLIDTKYYKENTEQYKDRVDKIASNFKLVKKALQLSDDY